LTTSGTATYNPTRDKIIYRALRMVGAYAVPDNPQPAQVSDAVDVLNIMLDEWQRGGFLWLKSWATLFLEKGKSQYILAPSTYSGFAHCVASSSPGTTPYVQTNTTVAAASGATSITVASVSGMANADYVGVWYDDGTIGWFYASISGLVISLFSNVTLTTPATLADTVASGNVVYSHKVAAQINRPSRVFSGVRKLYDSTAANGYEIPLTPILSRTDYENLPNKTIQGMPIQYYYDPQLAAGLLYIWPTTSDMGTKLVLTIDRPIQDIITDTETFDVPREAFNAIAYNLAVELEPEYPLDPSSFSKLKVKADEKLLGLINYNREIAPTQFSMEQ
jgi:hypothetical protein